MIKYNYLNAWTPGKAKLKRIIRFDSLVAVIDHKSMREILNNAYEKALKASGRVLLSHKEE